MDVLGWWVSLVWFFLGVNRNSTSKLDQLDEISDEFQLFWRYHWCFFSSSGYRISRNQLIRAASPLPSWLLNSVASFLARNSVFHKTPASYATTSNTFVIPSTNGTNGTCTPWWLWCKRCVGTPTEREPFVVPRKSTLIRCPKWKERRQCWWPVPWRCFFLRRKTKNERRYTSPEIQKNETKITV